MPHEAERHHYHRHERNNDAQHARRELEGKIANLSLLLPWR